MESKQSSSSEDEKKSEQDHHQSLLSDLLVCLSAPRWHLLSWTGGWPQLEQRCQELLRDPMLKRPREELSHLVIDYAQFDEWSSDEEDMAAVAGIEAGYEDWEDDEEEEEEEEQKMEVKEEPKEAASVAAPSESVKPPEETQS